MDAIQIPRQRWRTLHYVAENGPTNVLRAKRALRRDYANVWSDFQWLLKHSFIESAPSGHPQGKGRPTRDYRLSLGSLEEVLIMGAESSKVRRGIELPKDEPTPKFMLDLADRLKGDELEKTIDSLKSVFALEDFPPEIMKGLARALFANPTVRDILFTSLAKWIFLILESGKDRRPEGPILDFRMANPWLAERRKVARPIAKPHI